MTEIDILYIMILLNRLMMIYFQAIGFWCQSVLQRLIVYWVPATLAWHDACLLSFGKEKLPSIFTYRDSW